MNLILESLNQWGVQALRVAWPMLWQSSLLIGLLFAAEALLRHRVRAAVRYALWLVVLLKLVLPPALALPTGLGWWLRPTAVRPAPAATVSVTFNESAPQSFEAAEPMAATPLPEPTATLGLGSWVLLGSGAVSLALLGWMLLRWRQVARDLREATAAPESVCRLAEELRTSLGLRQDVRIRLTERAVSPGVCGLFRPVILLPRLVTERLAPAQLRAVLLHELIHLRRGDVWVNCGQALLQLVYWWHPLVWFANARIRQLREEAVDDAVMLALQDEAETYAPTLLEVARLALRRQMPSLGLVGILESRNALRQRIQRLLEFHPPRRAGLTLASAFAVLAFAALAVPMGEAPGTTQQPVNIEVSEPAGTTTAASASPQAVTPSVDDTGSAVPGTNSRPAAPPAGSHGETNPFPSTLDLGSTNRAVPADELHTRTYRVDRRKLSEMVQTATGRPAPAEPDVDVEGLQEVFKAKGVDLTPPKSLFFNYGQGDSHLYFRASARDLETIEKTLSEAGILRARGSTNSVAAPPEPSQKSLPLQLISASFRVETNKLFEAVRATTGRPTQADAHLDSTGLREFFKAKGVDLSPPKSLWIKPREGLFYVRATQQDLDLIEKAVSESRPAPSQVLLQVKFLEVPEAEAAAFRIRFAATNEPGAATWNVKLSAAETADQLAHWESGAAKLLCAPQATTLSGRQVQMKVQDGPPLIISTNSVIPTNQASIGPAFDFVPTVGADGFTISTPIIITLTELLGYQESPTNHSVVPQFRCRQLSSQCSVLDGQTVVLGGLVSESVSTVKDKVAVLGDLPLVGGLFRHQTKSVRKAHLMAVLTPRLMTPTGYPVHPDETLRALTQPKR